MIRFARPPPQGSCRLPIDFQARKSSRRLSLHGKRFNSDGRLRLQHVEAPPHWRDRTYDDLPSPAPPLSVLLEKVAALPRVQETELRLQDIVKFPENYDNEKLRQTIDDLADSTMQRLALLSRLSHSTNAVAVQFLGFRTAVTVGEFLPARRFLSKLSNHTFTPDESCEILELITRAALQSYQREYRFGAWKRREALLLITGSTPNLVEHLDLSISSVKCALSSTVTSLGGRSGAGPPVPPVTNMPSQDIEETVTYLERILSTTPAGSVL
ncbi:MAG: hypothetical protein M1814_005797 [Vezdaea aestivalis]|nr:MAG: hypothetical protein M1814_005797 [Vezdaea aestivalis]